MRRNVWDLVSGFSIILGGVGIIYAAYCYMNPQSKLIGDIGYLIGIIVIFSGFPLLWHYFSVLKKIQQNFNVLKIL